MKTLSNKKNVIVLSIYRGGIIIDKIISKKLGYDFGLIISRKLTVPNNQELVSGAITNKNNFVLNNTIIKRQYYRKKD